MKEFVKRFLKGASLGRVIYPFCHSLYRLYSVPRRRRVLRRYGYEALQRIHDALTDAGVGYFVDYGTLLGLVRNHALIRHDTDMDLALIPSERTLCEVCGVLQKRGFVFNRAFEYDGKIVCLNLLYNGIPVDFFRYYQSTSDGTIHCFSMYWDEARVYQSVDDNSVRCATLPMVMECAVRQIHGTDVSIPTNAEAILAAEYGKDWGTPNARWQEEQAPNLRECDQLGRAVGFDRMQTIDAKRAGV